MTDQMKKLRDEAAEQYADENEADGPVRTELIADFKMACDIRDTHWREAVAPLVQALKAAILNMQAAGMNVEHYKEDLRNFYEKVGKV